MMAPRRINVRGIIYKDGKIFAQRLHDNNGKFWSTPGGGLDPGESLIAGLHREMIEETAVAPKIGKLLFIQQFDDGVKEQLEFFFLIENADDYSAVNLALASHGELEVDECEFIDPKTEVILPAFLQKVDMKEYTEHDRPVYLWNGLDK